MINMLTAIIDKIDIVQEQMGNIGRELELLNIQKEILEIKITITKIKKAFDKLISRLNQNEEKSRDLRIY